MQNYCIVQFLGGLNLLRRSSRKISLSMKLLFILIVCSFGLAYASDGYAQKTSITLKANDCTIEEVLHKIELESGFGFFVNSMKKEVENYRWNYVQDKPYPCNETRSSMLARLEKCDISIAAILHILTNKRPVREPTDIEVRIMSMST